LSRDAGLESERHVAPSFTLGSKEDPTMTDDQAELLRNKITDLQVEHDDLDDVIARMEETAVFDDLQLRRLKKRKLYLKDHITYLERQLTQNIPA
jgi:hypothetical protein